MNNKKLEYTNINWLNYLAESLDRSQLRIEVNQVSVDTRSHLLETTFSSFTWYTLTQIIAQWNCKSTVVIWYIVHCMLSRGMSKLIP